MITNTELEFKGNLYPTQVVEYRKDSDKYYFTSQNGVILEITILRNSALRVRYATDHVFEPDFSYAISPNHSRGFDEIQDDETDSA